MLGQQRRQETLTMKKLMIFGSVGIVGIVAVMAVMCYLGVRANDGALEEIRGNASVVVLNVSGMT